MSARTRLSLPEATPEERKRALEDPGPSWREWAFGSLFKIYLLLGFLIVDSWIAALWLEPARTLGGTVATVGLLGSLAAAVYGEYVAFLYLYALPRGDPSRSTRSEFRPTWLRPFEFGRWTEPGRRVRLGLPPYGTKPTPEGPDPTEFF